MNKTKMTSRGVTTILILVLCLDWFVLQYSVHGKLSLESTTELNLTYLQV